MKLELTVLDDSQQPWFSQGLSFACTSCGNCCSGGPGYVWITLEEVDRLAAHLGLTPAKTIEKYCRRIGRRLSLKERRNAQGNYDCIFLQDKEPDPAENGVRLRRRICGVYAARPLQCRTWPFWQGNLASKEDWEHAARRCPGMNRGKRYPQAQIEARRDAKEWPEE